MAPRTSFKGFLKLSLVSVPVRAYTANNTSEDVRLNQLHVDCHNRVKYKKVCPEHGELKSDEIVSGYEYAKDSYVVIEANEVSKIRKESDKSVHIDGFVSPEELDPMYLAGKTYFLLPDGIAGNRPYALLVKGMRDANVVGVAQVVLSGREQLVCLRPVEDMLTMSVLSYPKKLKAMDPFIEELPDEKPTQEEMALANTLIGASTIKEFDFASYKDAYIENLTKLIQMKVDGQEIVKAPDVEEPKILNLMEALKKSVAEAGARKMAPSVKSAKKTTAKKRASKKATTRKKKTG